MAERHTVDVDVVGSKPIRLPEESLFEGLFLFEAHQAYSLVGIFLLQAFIKFHKTLREFS